uniref:Strawberry notch AAA domain-containing protein n=1 Tax=Dunaliella tertiolecta TaxID=3047 RepID=A0A7S3QMH8_DUNTE
MSSSDTEDEDVQVVEPPTSSAPPLRGPNPSSSSLGEPVEQQLKRMISDMQRANRLEPTMARQVDALGVDTVVSHFAAMAPFVEKVREMYAQLPPVYRSVPAPHARAAAPGPAPAASTYARPALPWGAGAPPTAALNPQQLAHQQAVQAMLQARSQRNTAKSARNWERKREKKEAERIKRQAGLNGGTQGLYVSPYLQQHQLAVQAAQAQAEASRTAAARENAEMNAEDVIAEEDEEEMDQVNLYAQYRPAKVREGENHPDPIVESQSLAGVTPPDVTYKHHLSAEVKAKKLSNAQLETVLYSMMRFNQELPSGERAGFFLGDGAGVGKGRQIAAIIKEFWATGGRRVLWVSTSRDLAYDARRDLDDIGCSNVAVHPKNKDSPPTGNLDKHYKDGVLFITYSLLTVKGKSPAGGGRGRGKKKGRQHSDEDFEAEEPDPFKPAKGPGSRQANRAMSAARKEADRQQRIDSLSAQGSRLNQIKEWLQGPKRKGEDALIIFDECHRAKNLLDANGGCTMTGLAVDILQTLLPKARVLYSSATGASEPQNMMYMRRVGSYGFADMKEMITSLNKSGLGGVEMFAMGLKATGAYLCRTLSYRDAEFRLETIDIDPAFKILYDRSTQFWSLLLSVLRNLPRGENGGRDPRKGLFWAAHQRFYKGLLIAAKVNPCVKFCRQALQDGMCVVIGMQSTGEANMSAARDLEGDEGHDDLVSAPKMVLHGFITKHLFKGFGELSNASLDRLLAQVYTAVCEWRGLKPAAEEAVVELKSRARRQAREEKARKALEEKRRRQEEAEEAEEARREAAAKANKDRGGASTSATLSPAAKSAGAAALARASGSSARGSSGGSSAAKEGSDDDDGIEVVEERDLEQALQARQQAARLAGNFIDLTRCDMDDEKVAANMAALEAEELAEAEAKEAAKVKEQEQEYVVALDKAKAVLASLQEAEAQKPASGKGGPSEEALEDSDAMDKQNEPLANGNKASGHKRVRCAAALADSDNEEGAEEEGSKRARGANGQAAVVPVKIKPDPESAGMHRAADEDGDDDLTEISEEEDNKGGPNSKRKLSDDVVVISDSSDGKSGGASEGSEDENEEEVVLPTRSSRRQAAQNASCRAPSGPPNAQILAGGARGIQAAKEAVKAAERALARFRHEVEKARNGRAKREADKKAAAERQRKQQQQAAAWKNLEEVTSSLPSYQMSVLNKPLPQKGKKQATGGRGSRRASRLDDEDDTGDEDDLMSEDDDLADGLGLEDDEDRADPLVHQLPPQLRRVRKLLLRLLDAMELPPNPLDQLTELLGGESMVAEMTGRKGMMVRGADGKVAYKQRREEDAAKMVNLREKEDFMSGRKLVAVISEAASTGISLQADRRVSNQRRRFHITLELPWSADRAIQQFGRSHRSNQSSAPVYCLMVSNCGGEYRFAGAVAKRLASLGALLQGDQRAMGAAANLKAYDIDTSEAGDALKRVYEDICGRGTPMPGVEVGNLPDEYFSSAEIAAAGGLVENIAAYRRRDEYYTAMQRALLSVDLVSKGGLMPGTCEFDPKTCRDVPRFLNRMLGLQIHEQQLLFEYFASTLQAVIRKAKSEGVYQEGMTVLRNVPVYVDKRLEIHRDLVTDASTHYVKLRVDDGLTWEAAKERRDAVRDELISKEAPPEQLKRNGFYIARNDWKALHMPHILLCTEIAKAFSDSRLTKYRAQRPYQSQSVVLPEHDLLERYRPLRNDEEAEHLWKKWFTTMATSCLHGPNCNIRKGGGHCYSGSRIYFKHMVYGALLPVLHQLFKVHETSGYGRSSSGKKPPPHALRCNLIVPPEEQQPSPGQLRGQQHENQQETLDLTHEEEDDEGSAEGANASSPSAHGRRDGAGPSSTVANPQEPHTRLMVGFEMFERDVDLLLTSLEIQPNN